MFLKLSEGISYERRNYITNGIRQHFKDFQTVLVDIESVNIALEATLIIFNLFVIIIGAIALLLAFFLLSVSTT
jgi:hypothetical protein